MVYKLYWTDEAVQNLEDILGYLTTEWTQKEVDNFKKKLSRQIKLIIISPMMFPLSDVQPRLRKAVLSSQTSIFYELIDKEIFIAYIFVNKRDIRRIK